MRGWPGLLVLSAGAFGSVTTEMLPTGLLPQMSRDMHVSQGRLGLVVTGYAVMVAVFATPLTSLAARLPRRALAVLALLGYAASSAAVAVAPSYPWLVAARLVGGAVHGVFWAMIAGYAVRMVPAERAGRATAVVFAGGTLAILAGVPAGTALGVATGWRPAFALLAGATLAVAGLGARLLPDLPGVTGPHRPRLAAVLRTPGLRRVVALTGLAMLGFFTFYTYVAPFLLHAGLHERQVGPALFGYGSAEAAGLALAGVLIDRRLPAVLVAGTGALTLALAALLLPGMPTPLVLAVAGLSALAMGLLPISVQAAVLRVAPHAADQASALNASAFNVGIGGGALLGGVTLGHLGPAAVPGPAAACTALATVAALLSRRALRPADRGSARGSAAPPAPPGRTSTA